MTGRGWLVMVLKGIGALTMVSGALQVVVPGFVLDQLAVHTNAASLHFFAIVGMFMILFGGLLLHALFSATPQPIALLWSGLQKLGAFAAIALGVINGVFSSIAWLVAFVDLLSGALIIFHWRSVSAKFHWRSVKPRNQ